MRGLDKTGGALFSYVDLEERVPARPPLRKVSQMVNDALASLDAEFEGLYGKEGRLSIAPESLIRASQLQILFSIRSERQLMEQLDYNLLVGWAWDRRSCLGRNRVHQEPGPAADDGHVVQGDGRDPCPS